MSNSRPYYGKPLSQIMKSKSHDLQHLFEKMYELNQLKKAILPLLDKNLHPHVKISCDFRHTLVLIVSDDSIATRLRLQKEQLREQLEAMPAYRHLSNIGIKVASYQYTRDCEKTSASHPVALLSEESAAALKLCAETITHPALKAALERIASRKKSATNR